jgi:hypothetical protein
MTAGRDSRSNTPAFKGGFFLLFTNVMLLLLLEKTTLGLFVCEGRIVVYWRRLRMTDENSASWIEGSLLCILNTMLVSGWEIKTANCRIF